MATYKSKEALTGNVLEEGDTVIFTIGEEVFDYRVQSSFLLIYGDTNAVIFERLGLNATAFCEQSYGSAPTTNGAWPTSENNDFEALTRLCLDLFKEIEKQSKPKQESSKLTKNQRIKALEEEVAEMRKLLIAPVVEEDITEVDFEDKFDPENPTVDNMPTPWMCGITDRYGARIEFTVEDDDSSFRFRMNSGNWTSEENVTPIPYSQWPKLLIDHYNDNMTTFYFPELPTY